MSKEEDIKFLKIQTCVLKVNIHCDGCKQKVKKLLHKIEGVYTTSIDAEQGKVTISGNVDPSTLIKKLSKSGKHAELISPKPTGKAQPENPKGGGKKEKDNDKDKDKEKQKNTTTTPKGGGSGNNQKGQPPQVKGLDLPQLKDLKMAPPPPFGKDPKSVKFDVPEEDEGSEFDDEFDDDEFDDEDFDELDGFEDEFEEEIKNVKPVPVVVADAKKGGGGGGGNGKKGGDGKKGGNQNPAGGGGGGGGKGNGKNAGVGNQDGKNGGGGGNNNKNVPNKKGGGGGGGKNEIGGNPAMMMAPGQGFPAGMPMPMPMPMPSNMGGNGGGNHPMGMPHMGMGPSGPALQGLPARGPPPGYFQGGGPAMPRPEVIAAANPYQHQQYMAAMMQQQQQQQQQRMMMMNGGGVPDGRLGFQPMAYARPPVPVNYMPPPPEYTHFFSDENTNSCSMM